MNRHSILERNYPQVPAVELLDCRPEPVSIWLLWGQGDRVFNRSNTPLLPDVGALAQDFVLEVLGKAIDRHMKYIVLGVGAPGALCDAAAGGNGPA